VKNDKSFLNYKKCNLYRLVYILRLRVKLICIKWLYRLMLLLCTVSCTLLTRIPGVLILQAQEQI